MQIPPNFFNPRPEIGIVPIGRDAHCVVVDDALADPHAAVAWAVAQRAGFQSPRGYPYPGVVLDAPDWVSQRIGDYFAQHARGRLGGRRTLDSTVRFSVVCTPPGQLEPCQWLCHRDRVADDPRAVLFAASVLYLFDAPQLGGTSFYVPRRPLSDLLPMLADSQVLTAHEFTRRHGVQPGYMAGSNAHFEQVARIPAAWNRMIFYDGGLFHSGDIDDPSLLENDPGRGRLTLNSFFTCKRAAA
jgi:hypothetical protein